MIVDANLLLYARNEADPRHPVARAWLEDALNGSTRVGLPRWSLSAFLRIATNPRAFPDPLAPADAILQLEEWLAAPRAWLVEPTPQYRFVIAELVLSQGSIQ